MDGNFGSGDRRPPVDAANAPPISRREFLAGALAVAPLLVAEAPGQARAVARRSASARGRARANAIHGLSNVQVSRGGPGRGHAEPWLAVNPRNPRNLLAVSMWGPDAYVSFDGGQRWHSGGTLRLPPNSGGGNVSAAFDSAGRGFVCGSFGSPSQSSVLIWRTDDGGRTFTHPTVIGQSTNLDRPWLATDRHTPGMVHVAWAQGTSAGLPAGRQTDLRYTRSTNAGQTFDTPRTIARNSAGLGNPMLACGAPSTVYILYTAGHGEIGNAPADSAATVTIITSHDQGNTFHSPIAIGTGTALPAIAAHPNNGLVCAAFIAHHRHANHAGVTLATSHDAGRSWSRTTAITPQHQIVYFQPAVAIDDTGRIGVMAFAINHRMVNVTLTVSQPNSPRFAPPITLTNQPFDPTKVNYQLGDYQTLATSAGAFHALWNDTRTGQLELFTTTIRGSDLTRS